MVALFAQGSINKKIKQYTIGRTTGIRSHTYQYHDDSPILYCKRHRDSKTWAIRRANRDLTYLSYNDLHTLSQLDTNYLSRILGDGVGEKELEVEDAG